MKPSRLVSHLRPSSAAPSRWLPVLALSLAAGQLLAPAVTRAGEAPEIVSVSSSVFPGYARSAQSDGTFKAETYAFGEGGVQGGALDNPSFDQVRFLDVAHLIAPALATKNYQPCDPAEPRKTDLLIMVYWGTTNGTDAAAAPEYQLARAPGSASRAMLAPPPSGPGGTTRGGACGEGTRDPGKSGGTAEAQIAGAVQAASDSVQAQSTLMATIANRQRDRQNAENAAILGYLPELKRVDAYKLTALNQRRQDVVDELEESRYYVVLQAYDFQTLLVQKQKKLLWETRYSIRQRHNDFGRQLAAMTQSASRYFGQPSAGLIRTPIPGVKVELGQLTSLGLER